MTFEEKLSLFVGRIVLLFLLLAIIFVSAFSFADYFHQKECPHKDGKKCGWAWCKHYDGSDYLHDFSL